MVSIIILTYNSEQYIERLVESVYEFNKGLNIEVIVVDNLSNDKTIDKVNKLGKKVRLVVNKKNIGFAAGINSGVKQSAGKYLLFINPDCEWKSGSIKDFLRVVERNELIGIVGGKLSTSDRKIEKSAGKFLGILESIPTAFGLDEAAGVRFSPKKIQKVDYVSGAFMMVKKNVFDQLSGFDENLFMYIEDMEFCFRAKKKGVLTYFTPEAEAIHHLHGSSNRGFAVSNIYNGIFYFQKKHKGVLSYLMVKSLFVAKARVLVMVGKILNNKYLTDTYSEALKA